MFTTYILWSEKLGLHYVGHTDNVDRRLQEHRCAQVGFTARTNDWILVYRKSFTTREAAARHERRIKKSGARVHLAKLVHQRGLSPVASLTSEG